MAGDPVNPAYRFLSGREALRYPCPDCGRWHDVFLPFVPAVGFRFRCTPTGCPPLVLEVVAAFWHPSWKSSRGIKGISTAYLRQEVTTS